jgi:3-hydroxyisobutyrate dehydrogenase-like beta-hydroxyacid dehydrogenase
MAALPAAATWIDMTSSPAVGRVLFDAAHARGIGVLEAPASGACRRPGQENCSYSWAAMLRWLNVTARCSRCWPTRSTSPHVGGHGAGYLTKLLVNVLWFGQAIATAEAFAPGPARRGWTSASCAAH